MARLPGVTNVVCSHHDILASFSRLLAVVCLMTLIVPLPFIGQAQVALALFILVRGFLRLKRARLKFRLP